MLSLYAALISGECASVLKSFDEKCLALEKENARLRDLVLNLQEKLTKSNDAAHSYSRNLDKLRKVHNDDLQVTGNLRDMLSNENNARKMPKIKLLPWRLVF